MTVDVVVAGGGAAGLTAAAYAARAGHSVALVEKRARLGGLVQSVGRDGLVFDMGLRAIENAGIVLPMLEELGLEPDVDRNMAPIRRVMKDMDALYGIDNPLFKDVMRDRRYLFGTLLRWMFRFVATSGRINRMSIPVLEDPTLAPPGKTGLIVRALLDDTLTRRIRRPAGTTAPASTRPTR